MLVATYLSSPSLGQQDVLTVHAEADRLFQSVPTTTYDKWSVTDARNTAKLLLYFYKNLALPSGCGEFVCVGQACVGPGAKICNPSTRLKLTNSLGQYLSMWQPEYEEQYVEDVIGPDRMLYYEALTREAKDEIRGRAAYWAGMIPVWDVRPISGQSGKYVSFTVEGLLVVALRNPPIGHTAAFMSSATSVLSALNSLQQVITEKTPISIRSDVLRAMRQITGTEPNLILSSEIPGPYTDKEKSNIFYGVQSVKAHVTSLPDPPPVPPLIPDPWSPTEDDVPVPGPYPPGRTKTSRRRVALTGLGVATMLLSIGTMIWATSTEK